MLSGPVLVPMIDPPVLCDVFNLSCGRVVA